MLPSTLGIVGPQLTMERQPGTTATGYHAAKLSVALDWLALRVQAGRRRA